MSELIFKPLVDLIERQGGRIQGGRLASDLDVNPQTGRVQGVIARSRDGSETTYPADAVIFAVGITGGSTSFSRFTGQIYQFGPMASALQSAAKVEACPSAGQQARHVLDRANTATLAVSITGWRKHVGRLTGQTFPCWGQRCHLSSQHHR